MTCDQNEKNDAAMQPNPMSPAMALGLAGIGCFFTSRIRLIDWATRRRIDTHHDSYARGTHLLSTGNDRSFGERRTFFGLG